MALLLPVTKLPACIYSLFKILPRTPITETNKKGEYRGVSTI